MEAESVVHRPKEALKNWSDEGRLYDRLTNDINSLIADQKLEDLGDTCRTLVKLPFSSVSAAAAFISGAAQNGWSFFKDIQELRHVE